MRRATACQTFAGDEDGKHKQANDQNVQRKSTLQNPRPGMSTIGVFGTSKLWGGQDRAFLLWWS
jgi:hypothetical protein